MMMKTPDLHFDNNVRNNEHRYLNGYAWKPQDTAEHRRTPQDTAGRPCNDRRTPQLHPNDQYERLEKLLSQCFDV